MNNPVPMDAEQEPKLLTVCDVQFRDGAKIYYFDPDGFKLKDGDHVIIDTVRGPEFGYCAGRNHQISEKDVILPLRKVLRLATEQDEKTNAENREREKKAFAVCLQKIEEHQLDMQLVSSECAFDGSKILFFFTADERVDFRELVKDLASVFRTRIELRQIGVRDKAKMVGGLGVCGRPFCCKEFLDDFEPVSIKMAKTQSLSLNPTKISGTCGRLMCCLKYEQ
ncbi:MAG: stage 0 sporulation family protein, partial [Clostridia bacterium]|nr:stage 0 sporulation family protein [Clostridia bacterium]